jgi:hypothetical protein
MATSVDINASEAAGGTRAQKAVYMVVKGLSAGGRVP